MYCGICVEVCPFDALFWSPEYGYAAGDIAELTHERDQLRERLGSVPPPPALDPTGPVPAEVDGPAHSGSWLITGGTQGRRETLSPAYEP